MMAMRMAGISEKQIADYRNSALYVGNNVGDKVPGMLDVTRQYVNIIYL